MLRATSSALAKYFLIVAHPEPKSFNSSMHNAAVEALKAAGHEVQVSNLYEMNWNPISSRANFTTVKNPDYLKPQLEEMHATENNGFAPDVDAEMKKVEWCDVIVFQFPLWWFSMPAILRGWVDRTFAMKRMYGGGHIYETGVNSGKKAILSVTTGGPAEAYVPGGFNGDINGVLRPIHRGILQFTGFSVLEKHMVYGPVHLTEEQRKEAIAAWAKRVTTLHEEKPIEVGQYA